MTREEEIKKAVQEFIEERKTAIGRAKRGGWYFANIFEEGIKWADEHPQSPWIGIEELQYLRACEFTLHQVNNIVGLCPACKKAVLISGLVCLNCGYDDSYTLEEWQQIKKQ